MVRVIDDDDVSLDNLQRQTLFGTGDVGGQRWKWRARRLRGSTPTSASKD
jgi:molybdopterin/thiamine biosynthesis adenylyltransferase